MAGVKWRSMRTFVKTKRARYSASEREGLVAAWRSSGQTQAAFARECQVRLGTLRRWVYRSEAAGTRGPKSIFGR